MEFKNISELRAQAIKDEACEKGIAWLDTQNNLEDLLNNIKDITYTLFCLVKGYTQFADKCDWNKLDGLNWLYLLKYQPQFADKCDWDKLDGCDWSTLLRHQPQFADKCDWGKLNNYDWLHLLRHQPQFAEYRK